MSKLSIITDPKTGTQTITNFTKSKSDDCSYSFKIFPNGLKALIVSDSQIEQSAASMSVNIGSLVNPKTSQGIAHFCEHMILMGSEKYPDEEGFKEFLTKNGGSSNAYTELDCTTYYFNCSNNHFREGLDRFANIFIKPLFNSSSVERELHAIDSEHSKNINSDIWRFMQLTTSEFLPDSKFNLFATGNLQTLQKPTIREELIEFYNKYYSSEVMNLCVYSSEPIDEITSYVESLFSQIPKIPSFIKPDFSNDIPYDNTNTGFLYYIEPVQNKDTISFLWFLPNELPHYKSKPLAYLSCLFGHEGPNTLTSSLTKDDLITQLITYKTDIANTFSYFKLEVELTDKGKNNYNDVILRVFKYIKTIQDIGVNKRFFDENKLTSQLTFDYKQKTDALKTAQAYSKRLLYYNYEDILIGDQLYQQYSPELIEDYLSKLLVSNCNVYISSKSLSSKCNLVEPIYGTKYYKEKHSFKIEDVISYQNKHVFDYPPENIFLPTDMSILPAPENIKQYPECIIRSKRCLVWYKQDTKFKLPYAVIRCKINFEKYICGHSEIVNNIITNILSAIVVNELRETLYMTEVAKVKVDLNIKGDSMSILVSGFNKSMYNVIKVVLEQLMKIVYDNKNESYMLLYNKKLQQLSNFYFSNSYLVAYKYLEFALNEPSNPNNEVLQLMVNNQKELNLNMLLKYVQNYLKTIKVEWLIQGNISQEEAIKIVTSCNEVLKVDTKTTEPVNIHCFRSVNITSNTEYIYALTHPNVNEVNSSMCIFYQCGHLSIKDDLILEIVCNVLESAFFDQIRTKEQIGYVTMLLKRTYRGNSGLIALVQSSHKSPEYVVRKVKEFFNESQNRINNLTDNEFEEYRKGVLIKHKKDDLNLYEEVLRNITEIIFHEYQFDRKEKEIESLDSISKKDIIDFYYTHFINDIRMFTMEYIANAHKTENDDLMNNKTQIHFPHIKRVKVTTISDFQMRNELFPDYYNLQD